MDGIRQIALQLPEGLQRLQLNFLANGLIGWSAETTDQTSEDNSPQADNTATSAHHSQRRRSSHSSSTQQTTDTNGVSDDDDADAYADAQLGIEPGPADSDNDSNPGTIGDPDTHGMTDEEQVEAIQAFIVADDCDNPTLQEAALVAATQLVEALADESSYISAEVMDSLQDVHVHLNAVDGGLQLKIGHGVMARSIYIYGDDDDDTDDDDEDDASYDSIDGNSEASYDEEEGSYSHTDPQAYLQEPAVVSSSAAAEQGAACPVCFSAYCSNLRMAALGCHHHVCNSCLRRLPRPKLCPICRARISSHVEVIM